MNIAIYNYQEFNEYIGGIERVSISLTRSLLKRGVNVIFVAVHKSQYDIEYETPVPMYFYQTKKLHLKQTLQHLKQY